MPATPAWPPHSTPRLFVDELLGEGSEIRIDGGQAHYLLNVMRLKQDGSYSGIIFSGIKKYAGAVYQAK